MVPWIDSVSGQTQGVGKAVLCRCHREIGNSFVATAFQLAGQGRALSGYNTQR